MPFIPNTDYGVAYMAACLVAVGISFLRHNLHARIVSLVFLAHWVSLRLIAMIDHNNNAALWIAHDAATIAVLGFIGWRRRSRLSFACAAVFFAVMLFDQYWWLFESAFEANAAVAEAGGYLCFVMIAGAAIGTSSGGYWSRGSRWLGPVASLEGRRAISRHSKVFGRAVASIQNSQEKDCG